MKRRAEAGFTLISVLIAIVMLAIGLMSLARTQGLLARTAGGSSTKSAALAIAQDFVEVLRSRDPATLASEGPVSVGATGTVDSSGAFQRTTFVSTDSPNLRRVIVRVVYPGGVTPIEITTLVFQKSNP